MEPVRRVSFTTALSFLQGMLDSELTIMVTLQGGFFGCSLGGRLESVESLPPDRTQVLIGLDRGQGVFLDPAALAVYVSVSPQGRLAWIEFHVTRGRAVTIRVTEGSSSDFT
jgi:hypothetical protein